MKDDQRVVLTKRLLREGLIRLLTEKDISKINVSELCVESGINRATFYRHYQQPRDIISEIRLDMFNDIRGFAEKDNVLKNTVKWLEDMCTYFYNKKEMLQVLFRCRTDDEFVAFLNELYRKHINIIRDLGFAENTDDETLKLATYYFAGGVFYILRQWIMEPIDKTPREVAEIIYSFLKSKQ